MEKSHLFLFRSRGAGDCGATTSVSGVFWRQYWLQLIRQGIWRLLEHVVAAIVAPSFPFPVGFAAKRPGWPMRERDNLCTGQRVIQGDILFGCSQQPYTVTPSGGPESPLLDGRDSPDLAYRGISAIGTIGSQWCFKVGVVSAGSLKRVRFRVKRGRIPYTCAKRVYVSGRSYGSRHSIKFPARVRSLERY